MADGLHQKYIFWVIRVVLLLKKVKLVLELRVYLEYFLFQVSIIVNFIDNNNNNNNNKKIIIIIIKNIIKGIMERFPLDEKGKYSIYH